MKPIILLTMPHTGTHTMVYLLAQLCGGKVYHNHLDGSNDHVLDKLYEQDLSDTVFVITDRTLDDMKESYAKRYPEDAGTRLKKALSCHDYACARLMQHPMVYRILIDEQAPDKTAAALKIMKAAELPVSPAAQAFMKTWPKMNSRKGEEVSLSEDEADFMSRAKRRRIPHYLREYHNIDLKVNKHGG